MIIKNLVVKDNRNWLNGQRLAHFVWDHYNPNNPWKKGYAIHHKDGDSLNDHISNLEKMKLGDHGRLHNSGEKSYWYGKIGPNKNKIVSTETRKKIGEKSKGNKNWLGKKHTEETKEKISKSGKGRVVSEETKINISKAKKGKVAKNKGIPMSNKQKIKISQSQKGKVISKETREKLSEAIKQYWAKKKLGLI